jgi:hypothetical protein
MPLITLFSSPKPFTDPRIALIQGNAIQSWVHLPEVEVLLIGEEEGAARVTRELNVRLITDVARNAKGTPLISSMFHLARDNSSSPLLGIINTDILLMSDFVDAAKQMMKLKEKYVMLSQRWDINLASPLEFSADWQDRLRSSVLSEGRLHRPAGSDYFVFPRDCYSDVPDFAIGRAGWDNWMIYKARKEKLPVIDCTSSVMVIHQNHDYGHLPDSKPHYNLPETDDNIRLASGQAAVRYSILDATARLAGGKLIRPEWSHLRFMRAVELFLRRIFFFLPEDRIENVARPKRWQKRIRKVFGNRKS